MIATRTRLAAAVLLLVAGAWVFTRVGQTEWVKFRVYWTPKHVNVHVQTRNGPHLGPSQLTASPTGTWESTEPWDGVTRLQVFLFLGDDATGGGCQLITSVPGAYDTDSRSSSPGPATVFCEWPRGGKK